MNFAEVVAPSDNYFTDFEVSSKLEDHKDYYEDVVFKHIFNNDLLGLVVKHDNEEYVLMVNDLVSPEYFDNVKYDLFNDLFYEDFTKEEVDNLTQIEITDWLFTKGHAPENVLYLEPYLKTSFSKKGNLKISHTLGLKELELGKIFIDRVLNKLSADYGRAKDAINALPNSALDSLLTWYSF